MIKLSAKEITRAQQRLPVFRVEAETYRWPEEVHQVLKADLGSAWALWVLMGIDSRESGFGLLLDKAGEGDKGHGHGELQIDDRSHKAFCSSGKWRDLGESLRYVHKSVIIPAFNLMGADYFDLFNEDYALLFWGSVAAYNCGTGPGKNRNKGVLGALMRGRGLDANTTGRNYSADVRQRALYLSVRVKL